MGSSSNLTLWFGKVHRIMMTLTTCATTCATCATTTKTTKKKKNVQTCSRYRYPVPARTGGGVVRRSTSGTGEEGGENDSENEATSTSSSSKTNDDVKLDPFGFGSRRQDEPDKIIPGFDTAEGGKVGPVGTAAISLLLIGLFGGSFFFTSVPRESVMELAARDLANDPDAPTQTFARR